MICAFKHVDNLGAYSIPSETGLLISSDYVKWLMDNAFVKLLRGVSIFDEEGNVPMKMLFWRVSQAVALLLLIGIVTAKKAIPLFTIQIRPQRDVVKIGSRMEVLVTLTNNSEREVAIGEVNPGLSYVMNVLGPEGETTPMTSRMHELQTAVPEFINVHQFHLKPHGVNERSVWVDLYYDVNHPGIYSIQFQRQFPEALGTGVAKSNTINVKVEP